MTASPASPVPLSAFGGFPPSGGKEGASLAPTSVAPVVVFDEIDSTNAEARRRAEAGHTGPIWIIGLRQTAGRGRRGRVWETGPGNLAATYLFQTAKAPAEAAQMSFVTAVAVAEAVSGLLNPAPVTVKWPNDLLIEGKKAGGILVESGRAANNALWLAVGIGLNLATAPAAPLEAGSLPATALRDHMAGPPHDPLHALHRIAEALGRWRGVWEAEGFAPVAKAWTRRAHGLGARCVARLPSETVEGVALGLDAHGALRLSLVDGSERNITAGDVFF